MKNIAMLLVAGCAIGMLSGCGIPEDEHNAMVAELETKHAAEVDKLTSTIAEKDDIIKSEKTKVRQNRLELDDATERISGLQQKSAETSKAFASEKSKAAKLESELRASKSTAAAALDRATIAESKYSTLDVEYQELKRRFEMFQKNMSSIGGSSAPAAATTSTSATTPKSDADKAGSMLDDMGSY